MSIYNISCTKNSCNLAVGDCFLPSFWPFKLNRLSLHCNELQCLLARFAVGSNTIGTALFFNSSVFAKVDLQFDAFIKQAVPFSFLFEETPKSK